MSSALERPSSAPSRGALSRRSYVVLVGLVSLAPACTSEAVPTPSDVLDPVRGTVPELQRAEISVLVLPGNGYYALDEGGPDSSGLERIEFAFWATGDVVWSDGSEPGAARHRHARIAPEQVTSLAAEVEARISSTALREFMVFDTSHEQIRVRTKGSELLLVSCHELFESNPNLVALSYGITPLEGRAREDALAKEPAEFLAFRNTWSDVKQALRAALPKDGELVDRAKLATLGLK